jgi:phosphoribosylanthranilate isomerase
MASEIKICGLSTAEAVEAALGGGAAFVGFIFFPKSPRNVSPAAAAELAGPARGRARVVAVTVDPADAALDAIVEALKPDLIQLHGRETPERAAVVKARTGAGVIKAIPVSIPDDLAAAAAYEDVVDYLMFDARPPAGSELPGGVGATFDWDMLSGRTFSRPWFLAGGLTPNNISEAIRRSGAPLVDVSSGVETKPGLKDPRLIAAFLAAVRSA